jgi:hypothetical protein
VENNNGGKYSGYYSKKLKAGKKRTYFFDVRSTKQGDFFLTITETKKKFDSDSYENHKIFLYKEDFKKFLEVLNETVDYIKTELMPDYDYETEREAWSPNKHSKNDSREKHKQENAQQNSTSSETDSGNTSAPQISDDEVINWD